MSVVISGALIDGAGIPMSGCHIILKSRVNTSEVVMRTVADVVTGNCGEYCFKAQTGKYCVYLKQDWRDEYCVGDIAVYDDSKPGTLNDFLTAPDEGDLKPDVVKRFEEMVAQAQQSAEAAAESERQAGQHVADAQQIKSDCETLADNVQQNAEAVAEDKNQVALLADDVQRNTNAVAKNTQRVEQLASEVEQNAGQVQQGVQSVADAVKQARQAADDSASSAEDSKNNADNAAQSERNAKSHADNAAGNARQTAQDVTATAAARAESVDAAERASQYKEAASSAATSAENAANVALGHENNAAEYARQAKASQDASAGNAQEAKQHRDEAQRIVDDLKGSNASTTEKGLVQLCSDTDNDSEELAATSKAVKAVMDETKTKAPLDSPAFTGTPTTPTPPDDAAGLETANAAFVRKLLAALVDSSPEALDTLNELAAALGNDPNFATTVTDALAGKQPLNDVLTAVSQITPRKNSLLYYNESGNLTLTDLTARAKSLLGLGTYEKMCALMGLKAAATMEPQSDIRDRTPGRLALSGMYGFGQAFASTEALTFNGQADFAEWLKEATPGRYAVSIADSSTLLAGTTKFNGIIDVMWSPFDNDESDTTRKFKMLLCFNQYYEGEHSIHRLTYRWSGNNWNATVSPVVYDGDSLAFFLAGTAGNGPSSYYKYPSVGSLILAVYQGVSAGDKEIKIGSGDIVPGSRLGPVNISCSINDSGTYVSTPRVYAGGAGAYNFPGRYKALSGSRSSYGDEGRICLFVRIE
ncbi:prophage tail fiber N-terminal domain-containing protein [Escherichia coli]|uniref:prophage tail fiber N-terminal domain-containing protein n=8 Tax=Escherichia coli TaxID=562 RepID=UPI000CFA995C|nr:prophage tail fiber N-terminal domain-containing protein [Escherichia coli]